MFQVTWKLDQIFSSNHSSLITQDWTHRSKICNLQPPILGAAVYCLESSLASLFRAICGRQSHWGSLPNTWGLINSGGLFHRVLVLHWGHTSAPPPTGGFSSKEGTGKPQRRGSFHSSTFPQTHAGGDMLSLATTETRCVGGADPIPPQDYTGH